MDIYFGTDHRGYHIRQELIETLRGWGHNVVDMSNLELDLEDDYVDIAIPLAEKVARGNARGILICGSGAGMCVAANKVRGARAALFVNEKQLINSVTDDDINIACFGADISSPEEIRKLCEVFLKQKFSPEERFVRRLAKIKKYESIT